MRALVVSNMLPDAEHPERGGFVRDHVAALRDLPGIDVELYEFAPGPRSLAAAALALRRRFGGAHNGSAQAFAIVHAHFGLSAWPALAVRAPVRALTVHGTDVRDRRSRLATAAVLPFVDLPAAVSCELAAALPGRAARRRARVLPVGIDVERFRELPRAQARHELDLDPAARLLLFPADPARASKRHDRALELARACGAALLTLGAVAPARVALWVNAANAVLVPSEREGFGLAVLEALACNVPVLATPVGIHEQALRGIAGTLCAPFDLASWSAALEPHLGAAEPRVRGRERAEQFSTRAMARRVVDAWGETLERSGQRAG